MKKKKTERKGKIFEEAWIFLGLIIFAWTTSWFVYVRILNYYEFIKNVMFLVIGYCSLIVYLLITSIYFGIKRLKKQHKIK